ncbi:major facilitator superfamily domain-containing protein [Entophlyctis helioformis]|nr:major facilitator superfamily domain-containing protein [Entophlyctis helioformis]
MSPSPSTNETTPLLITSAYGSASGVSDERAAAASVATLTNPPSASDANANTAVGVMAPAVPSVLPWKQMFMICTVTFVEPVQFGVLFPFIYFLVRDFHIARDEKELGFYVGMLASSFCVAQLFTSLPWGWLSDRIGRRPVILIGLIGNAITCALFGASETYIYAISMRTLCGLLNGNIGVIKSMLGEISDASNRGIAFAYWESAFGIGTIVGPIIGGFLVDPVHTYPWLFGDSVLFTRFPYLLPCLVSAFISVLGAIAGFTPVAAPMRNQLRRPSLLDNAQPLGANFSLGGSASAHPAGTPAGQPAPPQILVEDDPIHGRSHSHIGNDQHAAPLPEHPSLHLAVPTSLARRDSLVVSDAAVLLSRSSSVISLESFVPLPESMTLSAVLTPNVILSIAGYAAWSLLQVLFDEIYALFIASPLRAGGLQFSSFDMGVVLSLVGVSQVFGQLVLYPMAERRWGYVGCFKLASVIMIVFSLILPFVGDYARAVADDPVAGVYSETQKLWVFVALMTVLSGRNIGSVIGFISVMVLVNDSAPGKHTLGTVHGCGQVAASFVRSVGPAVGGSLWAWSLTNNLGFPFDAHFTLFVTAFVALGSFALSFYIKHGPDVLIDDDGHVVHDDSETQRLLAQDA